jgi:uncharacterized beta-barrel protein YwiB (DUF1934 family)
MKIPIDIHVRSERIYCDIVRRGETADHPETDDFNVAGTLKKKKDGYRIEFSEAGDIKTLIDTFDDETVSINRIGGINSHMVFAPNSTHTCICNTELFPVQMRVRTKRLENTISMDGGKLDIAFTIEVVGNLAEKNRITFSVSPDKSILRS